VTGQGLSPLVEKLKDRIIHEGSLTYEAFINTALYDRNFGYYRQGKQNRLDYITSPEIHSAFGTFIGRYIENQFIGLDVTDPIIVELGGASGKLAQDILKGFTRHRPSSYYIIENGSERREGNVWWINAIDALPADLEWVFVITNELFDALPFHKIANNNGVLKEMYIGWSNGFFEKPGPLSYEVETFLAKYPISLPQGQVMEVTTTTLPIVKALSEKVHKGCFLIFDYGYHMTSIEAGGFADGSAIGYRNRLVIEDILSTPGEIDITHHVNFDHLSAMLDDYGWKRQGEIEQYRFLINCGILEDLMALPDTERLRAKWLINPEGLGSMMSVLGFSKGISEAMPGFKKM
jgi:SAM-dependent MidA family methyltransferase